MEGNRYWKQEEKQNLPMAPLSTYPNTTSLYHFTHPQHPLQLLYTTNEFLCNGCNELGVSGPKFSCIKCRGFDLHEHCATCAATISSPLHPHLLILVNKRANGRKCDLCGDLVNGLFYTCGGCNFDLHPLCTKFPMHVNVEKDLQRQSSSTSTTTTSGRKRKKIFSIVGRVAIAAVVTSVVGVPFSF
ncbi:hypothetical protein ACJIZ3_023044 [Penstemon smallii]|uniref:DC1 domain-containing protein n=1 Tax=Penstemon smallii TaxID=265156 RepID=A0ABD3TQA3_9LAMI